MCQKPSAFVTRHMIVKGFQASGVDFLEIFK